jgi:RNA polymerase sigma factor (sigma-70 family)
MQTSNYRRRRKSVSLSGPSEEREQFLIARARAGGGEAVRDEIILSLQPHIQAIASKSLTLQRQSGSDTAVERLDLIQSANVAILRQYELALEKVNPYAYLKRIAQLTIIDYLAGSPYRETYSHYEPFPTVSLDKSISEDGTPLAEMLSLQDHSSSASLPENNDTSDAEQDRKRILLTLLSEAIASLPEKQRMVIERHYGFGCIPESFYAISRSLSGRKARSAHPVHAHYYHRLALSALRRALASILPHDNDSTPNEHEIE